MKSTKITLAHIMPQQVKGLTENAIAPTVPKTAPQNDKKISREAREKRLLQLKSLRKILHEKFPIIFDYNEPLPLSVGIHKEIKLVFPEFSQAVIRQFLKRWVNDVRYLSAIITVPTRHKLNGEISSVISENEKEYSAKKL